MMVRSCSYVGLFLSVLSSIAAGQQVPTAIVDSKSDYRLVRPVATAVDLTARPFSDAKPHVVMDIVALKEGNELAVSEGDHLDTGILYKVDLKARWRGARYEAPLGICSIVSLPSRSEVVSSSWDSTVRFHDVDSLQPKASIPVDQSASRMAASADGSTMAIINEGYLNADISDGRTFWSVDINSRSQKSILGTLPFRAFNVSFSPDGKNLAVCGGLFEKQSGTISIFDFATAKQNVELKLPNCLFKLAYSTDGKWLIATGTSGTVTVNTQEGRQHSASRVQGRALHLLPGTDTVLIADWSNKFYQLSVPELKTLKTIASESGSVSALASLDNAKALFTGTQLGLQRWDVSSWKSEELIRGRIPVMNGFSPVKLLESNLIAVSRGKELLLCVADSGQLWNSHSFDSNIAQVVADDKRNRCGVILDDGTVHALDVLTGHMTQLGQIPAGSFKTVTRDLAAAIFVSQGGELTRYELDNGTTRIAPTKFSGPITNLVIADKGEICCGLASGDVIIFDEGLDNMIVQMPKVAVEPIVCLDWSRQYQRLVIAEKNGRLSLFERESQGQYQKLMKQELSPAPTAIALSATGDLIAVGHSNGTVSLLSPEDKTSSRITLAQPGGATNSCLFLKNDAGLVCSSGKGGVLSRVNLKTQPLSSTHRVERKANQKILSACLSLTGDECFIAVDGNIEVRSTKTWEKTQDLRGHRDLIERVRLSGDGQWLASTGHDSIVVIHKKAGNEWGINSTVFLPGKGRRIEWSPDGRWLLIATFDRKICVVDVMNWEIAHTFLVPFVPNTFSFSADSRVFVSSGINIGGPADLCTVQVWDATGWKQFAWGTPKTYRGHRHGVEAIDVSDDGKKFYSVAADPEMYEWVTDTGMSRKIRNLPTCGTSFSLLPDPRYALVSWHFASLAVLDTTDGSIVLQTEGHANDGDNVLMRDVVVSRDGQWAVSCAAADLGQGSGSVRLWRIGKQIRSQE